MRVGQYLVNGDGVVLAEPDELKRQTYGLGQKKLSLPKLKPQIEQLQVAQNQPK